MKIAGCKIQFIRCVSNKTRVMFLTNKVRVRLMIGVFLTKTIFQIKNKNNVGEYQFHFCNVKMADVDG